MVESIASTIFGNNVSRFDGPESPGGQYITVEFPSTSRMEPIVNGSLFFSYSIIIYIKHEQLCFLAIPNDTKTFDMGLVLKALVFVVMFFIGAQRS